MDDDLAWLSAHELRERVAARRISPVEVTQRALARIHALEPTLHAFITVCDDLALADARSAEAAVLRGDPLGPLHGVPVAIKDEAWVAGVPATAGSLLYADFVPEEDATVVQRLRAAGAIIVGKTNTPEFMSWSRTANRLMPETVNPWDIRRCPGASSGGSGAAVAAGLVPLAIGSDGGGSIRIPSASCGVIGIFPTPGRVPDTGSFTYGYCASMGPIGRDVRDIATMLAVIAGPDRVDSRLDKPPPDMLATLDEGVAGMRFAWTPDFGYIRLQRGLGELVRSGAALLEEAGAMVEEPGLRFDDAWASLRAQQLGHAAFSGAPQPFTKTAAFHENCIRPGNFERLTEYAQRATLAPRVTRAEYDEAQRRTDAIKARFDALFARYDAILSPTLPVVAPILPEGMADPYSEFCCGTYFTAIANLAELPAASFPVGMLEGMPVGMQIIGHRGREDVVLRICRALERASPAWRAPALALREPA